MPLASEQTDELGQRRPYPPLRLSGNTSNRSNFAGRLMAMRRFIMNVSTPEKWSQWENVPIDTVYSKQSEIHVQATKTAYFD